MPLQVGAGQGDEVFSKQALNRGMTLTPLTLNPRP